MRTGVLYVISRLAGDENIQIIDKNNWFYAPGDFLHVVFVRVFICVRLSDYNYCAVGKFGLGTVRENTVLKFYWSVKKILYTVHQNSYHRLLT